jgi:hypothetical protein
VYVGEDKSVDRGVDNVVDRGVYKGVEGGVERCVDRGVYKGVEGGVEMCVEGGVERCVERCDKNYNPFLIISPISELLLNYTINHK